MNSEANEYSLLWYIENYSYCGRYSEKRLVSPEFTTGRLKGTKWVLSLYPGRLGQDANSIYLKRSVFDSGPESLSLKLEVSVITADGSTLCSEEGEPTFRKGAERGFKNFLDMEELYVRKNTEYLPQDTLGVRCRMWHGEGSICNVREYTVRTRIEIEKISFLHRVENFSSLKLREKKILPVWTRSITGCVISSILYIADKRNYLVSEDTVVVEIRPSFNKYNLFRKKLSLQDVSGNAVECGEVDYRFISFEEDIKKLNESLTRQLILNKRAEYLPNDKLTLLCECTFSTGLEFYRIEKIQNDVSVETNKRRSYNPVGNNENVIAQKLCARPTYQKVGNSELKTNTFSGYSNAPSTSHGAAFNQMTNIDPFNSAEKLSLCPSALDDFKRLYKDQLFTDIVLRTATKSFPAHRIVLCARSQVFRAMLTGNMKEKNTNYINVDDLEDETLGQLLVYLYSDNIEELQWKSASRLYYAADKYAVERLKILCSSLLVRNLSVSTASELLLLADTHSDAELKRIVEDFILKHEKEIFGSVEWQKIIETNPQLAINTLQLKYNRR